MVSQVYASTATTVITPATTTQPPFRHRLLLRLEDMFRLRDIKTIADFFLLKFPDLRCQICQVDRWIVIDWQRPLQLGKIKQACEQFGDRQQTSSCSFVEQAVFDGLEISNYV